MVIETEGGLPKGEKDGTVTLKAGMKITILMLPWTGENQPFRYLRIGLRLGAMDQQMGGYESADGGRMEKRNHDCRFPSNCVHAY